jgi:hypothetical protein
MDLLKLASVGCLTAALKCCAGCACLRPQTLSSPRKCFKPYQDPMLFKTTHACISESCALQCDKSAGVTAQGGSKSTPTTTTQKPVSTKPTTNKKPSSNPAKGSNTSKPSGQPAKGSQPPGRKLREVEQCGGKGVQCEGYGSCADKAFPGYACGAGLICNRQNEWYWQVSYLIATVLGYAIA